MRIGTTIIGDLIIEVERHHPHTAPSPNNNSRYVIRIWHKCQPGMGKYGGTEGVIWYEECDEDGQNVTFRHGGLCVTEWCYFTLSLKNVNAIKMLHLLYHSPLGSCNNADL